MANNTNKGGYVSGGTKDSLDVFIARLKKTAQDAGDEALCAEEVKAALLECDDNHADAAMMAASAEALWDAVDALMRRPPPPLHALTGTTRGPGAPWAQHLVAITRLIFQRRNDKFGRAWLQKLLRQTERAPGMAQQRLLCTQAFASCPAHITAPLNVSQPSFRYAGTSAHDIGKTATAVGAMLQCRLLEHSDQWDDLLCACLLLPAYTRAHQEASLR